MSFVKLLAERQPEFRFRRNLLVPRIVRHGEFFEKMRDLIRRNSRCRYLSRHPELSPFFEQDRSAMNSILAVLGEWAAFQHCSPFS